MAAHVQGRLHRGGAILMSALAGIDQALWDIKGKIYNAPVYQLLGGACRNSMRVYSWVGGDRPIDVVKAALEKKAAGFTAIKMNASEEMQFIDTHDKIYAIVERVAAIREACGPEFGIAVDFHGRLHKPMARDWPESWTLPSDVHRRASAAGEQRSTAGDRTSYQHSDRHG